MQTSGVAAICFGTGAAVGVLIKLLLDGRRRRLPPPSQCPSAGVVCSGGSQGCTHCNSDIWVFLANHFANLEYYNDQVVSGETDKFLHTSYPARLHASAGFMRAWGSQSTYWMGDQTASTLKHVGVESGRAHAIVGVLVRIRDRSLIRPQILKNLQAVDFASFDWLGWTDPPHELTVVQVFALQDLEPPTATMPILQTHIDIIVEGALRHGVPFAEEWMDSIQWWVGEQDGVAYFLNDREQSRRPWSKSPLARQIDTVLAAHPPCNILAQRMHIDSYSHAPPPPGAPARQGAELPVPPPRAVRRVVRNFVFGFGSIIQTKSRAGTDPGAVDAAPCRISAEWGFVREWNFQSATAQICALGLRRVRAGERGASINGVCFPAPDDLTDFDRREAGYRRVAVPLAQLELLSWHVLPADARVYVYVPYAPAVVARYGADPATGLPRCSGEHEPEGLKPCEAAGLGLCGPSIEYPILQTYVDVVLSGCLEYGTDFAREFLRSTFLWSAYWLNERELARRPWLRQREYVRIDALLREEVPTHFAHRKLESEFAVLFHH